MSEDRESDVPAMSLRTRKARTELVRIDSTGFARPAGEVAMQRMRAREGAYRLLPSPGHIVFMRYTGEDGRRDEEDGAIVRLAGEIHAPGTMCEVLTLVGQSGWRGELVVLDGETARSIFFEKGNVVGAQTSVGDERIGMLLWRHGVIDEAQHEAIMERVNEGARFGQSGVELGVFTQETLFKYIAKQLDEIVFATFPVADGTYFFLEGFDDARLVSRHAVSATALLMDGLTRLDELRYFRQKIPSAEFVPARTEKAKPPADTMATYEAIDGLASIEDIGRATGRGEFETTKDVYTLLQSRHAALHPPRVAGGAAAVVARANAALVAIHQRVDSAGKGTTVRESLARFAPDSDTDLALLRSAGPTERGTLNAEFLVAEASRGDASAGEQGLKRLLHEYVAYALFCAGGALGSKDESELAEEIRPLLDELLPEG
jgi:hypothetical protein